MQTSKLKTLRILQMLQQYSDEENPLSATDLIERLQNDYGIRCERKSIYADIDAMSIEAEGVTMNFSGELGYGPLSGEVLPLEGEDLDVLAATEDDWGEIVMEAYGNIFGLMAQLAGVQ